MNEKVNYSSNRQYKNKTKKIEEVKNNSYMMIYSLAFQFFMKDGIYYIKVTNLKNLKQISIFRVIGYKSILFCSSNMSEANKYKSIAIVERNKRELIEGCKEWVNTQKQG